MSKSLRVAILGAGGRLGREVIKACLAKNITIKLALTRPNSADLGRDAGELAGVGALALPLTDAFTPGEVDVLIDVSSPEGTSRALVLGTQHNLPLVIATTGLSPEIHQKIDEAARMIPIVQSANMSLGVNLLARLVEIASKTLADFDIEIVEAHHRKKKDAPSGTALLLAQAAARGRRLALEGVARHGRHGLTGERSPEEIGIHALRGGSVVGDHQVYLLGDRERVILSHQAEDRAIFAAGTVRAAMWVTGQNPGRYTMADVLGL